MGDTIILWFFGIGLFGLGVLGLNKFCFGGIFEWCCLILGAMIVLIVTVVGPPVILPSGLPRTDIGYRPV